MLGAVFVGIAAGMWFGPSESDAMRRVTLVFDLVHPLFFGTLLLAATRESRRFPVVILLGLLLPRGALSGGANLPALIIGVTLAVATFVCFQFKKRYAMFAMIAALTGFSFSGRLHAELDAARSAVRVVESAPRALASD